MAGQPQKLEINKSKLILDYELEINGAGSPLDRGARRQEKLFLYSLLTRNPLVASRMDRMYAVTRSLLEEFEEPDISPMIGTIEEAQQMQEEMMKQKALDAQRTPGGSPSQAGGGGKVTGGPGAARPIRRRGQTGGNAQAPGMGGAMG